MANTWVFQANPKAYLVDEALRSVNEHTWLVNQHRKQVHAGDRVFIWKCGPEAGLVGVGIVLTDPAYIEARPEERKFEKQPLKFDGKRWRVRVKTERLKVPILRKNMLSDSVLKSWRVVKGWQGTNSPVSSDIEIAIEKMLS
ncbi:MAG: EVE domain-containing protein [Terriglobales bacterium]